jgi:hypothetical protein
MKIARIPKKGLGAAALTAALAATTALPAGPVAAAERETFTTYSSKEELKDSYIAELSANRGLPLCTELEESEEQQERVDPLEENTEVSAPGTDNSSNVSGEGASEDGSELVDPVQDEIDDDSDESTTTPSIDNSTDSTSTLSVRSLSLSAEDTSLSMDEESSELGGISEDEESADVGEPKTSDTSVDPDPVAESSMGAELSENTDDATGDDGAAEEDESEVIADDVECIDPAGVTLDSKSD